MQIRAIIISFCLVLLPLVALTQELTQIPQNQVDLGKSIEKKHFLEAAVYFQITPRGMRPFQNNIYALLQAQGSFQFEENLFSPTQIKVDPLDTQVFVKNDPERMKLIQTVRNFLVRWTQGFTLVSPHRFLVEIGNSGYQTRFTKFALVADPKLLSELKKADGVVMALELEAEKTILFADKIRVEDLSNPFLQRFGADQLQFNVGNTNQRTKLKFRIPFFVRLNPDSSLHFEVLQVEQNFKEMNIDFKYRRLVTGQFQIISRDENGKNEKNVLINTAGFSDLVNENKKILIDELKAQVQKFAQVDLPQIINTQARELFNSQLAFYDTLAPAGKMPEDSRPDFVMGHKIVGLKQNNGINIWISSLIEDPLNLNSEPNPKDRATKPPTLNLMSTENADGILVIDQGVINRYLQLSFLRKNFDQIESEDCLTKVKSNLKLIAAPVFSPMPEKKSNHAQETYAKLRISTEVLAPEEAKKAFKEDRDGVERIRFTFETAVLLRVMKDRACEVPVTETICVPPMNGNGACRPYKRVKKVLDPTLSCLEIVKAETQVNSIQLDKSNLSILGRLAEGWNGKVSRELQNTLLENDKKCAARGKQTTLAENVLIPPVLFGIKFDVAQFKVDENGQLVMYLSYKPGLKLASDRN